MSEWRVAVPAWFAGFVSAFLFLALMGFMLTEGQKMERNERAKFEKAVDAEIAKRAKQNAEAGVIHFSPSVFNGMSNAGPVTLTREDIYDGDPQP